MRRRSFLKGLLAVVVAPAVVAGRILGGMPAREIPVWSTRISVSARTLLRKWRQPIYDESSLYDKSSLTVTLFTRRPDA